MWIKDFIMGVIGFSCGLLTAGGVFALVVSIGVIPRLAGKTHTAHNILWYESSILLGGTIGNLITIFHRSLPLGNIGLGIFGIFSGIFVGCMAVALAEVLNTIPIFTRRIQLKKGIGFVMLSLAIGKGIGSLLYFFKKW